MAGFRAACPSPVDDPRHPDLSRAITLTASNMAAAGPTKTLTRYELLLHESDLSSIREDDWLRENLIASGFEVWRNRRAFLDFFGEGLIGNRLTFRQKRAARSVPASIKDHTSKASLRYLDRPASSSYSLGHHEEGTCASGGRGRPCRSDQCNRCQCGRRAGIDTCGGYERKHPPK